MTTEAGYDEHSSYPAFVLICAFGACPSACVRAVFPPRWLAQRLASLRSVQDAMAASDESVLPAYIPPVRTCDFCGKRAEDDAAALTWTTAVENGRQRTFCDTCSREHLRAMESKLDSEWW